MSKICYVLSPELATPVVVRQRLKIRQQQPPMSYHFLALQIKSWLNFHLLNMICHYLTTLSYEWIDIFYQAAGDFVSGWEYWSETQALLHLQQHLYLNYLEEHPYVYQKIKCKFSSLIKVRYHTYEVLC